MREVKIPIPIYGGHFIISVGDLKTIEAKYGLNRTDSYAGLAWVMEKKGVDRFHISLPNPRVSESTICHEAVHIKNYVFKSRGMKLDIDNDEAEAYFVGWIVNEVFRFCQKLIDEDASKDTEASTGSSDS